MNGTDDAREARVSRLRDARTRDSDIKRHRAIAAIAQLSDAGERVTIAAVARVAQVSTWLIYNNSEVKAAVSIAMDRQTRMGTVIASGPKKLQASEAGLQAELSFVREELRSAKSQIAELKRRVQLALGAYVDGDAAADATAEIARLRVANAAVSMELATARREVEDLKSALATAGDELIAARASLRKTIRALPPIGSERE